MANASEFARCEQCRTLDKAVTKKRRSERANAGICTACGDESLWYNQLCEQDWYKQVANKHFGTHKKAPELIALAVKQGFRCFYSGVEIMPGLNMSLDHVIPKSRDPELKRDMTNVVWCSIEINYMKGKLSAEDFVALCELVVNHNKRTI